MDEIKNKIWAIGGGKGGVGKSLFTLLLGDSLAQLGNKVILVDADLGGSNLHTFAGIRYPRYTLADFIGRRVESMDEVVVETPINNLKLICGADDILGIANPKYTQKTRLLNHLKNLDADFILLDLGAGVSFTTMDFFLYAPNKIVVITPQATSIQNGYGFIKASLYRKLHRIFRTDPKALEIVKRSSVSVQGESIDSIAKVYEAIKPLGNDSAENLIACLDSINIKLVVNMVRKMKEKDVSHIVKSVAKNYLSLEIEDFGIIQYDKILETSINNMAGFLKEGKDCASRNNFYDIAYKVLKGCRKLIPAKSLVPNTSSV
jgi:flagellar biosynthesis protein FlhG